jgi:hypothetical protein
MPSLEQIYDHETIFYVKGKPRRPIDVIHNTGPFEQEPKRKKYSTRALRRKEENARQRYFAEPHSFSDAIEKGLNYYWDSGE